ncbi:hypothetical protein [uncultured Aquimarina sp.]|uniref:hypothetical protein n=1 Tax=uncultured Aquimarina sp. TaxID=575652 RepID=UPI0026081A63|nr:hypothetical protein [uncultured Aquimarina sp.]
MFDIFKKKNKPSKLTTKTILCIPGNWTDRNEIVSSIAENNLNEFIFAGMILLNLKTNQGFKLEICERDDRMRNSFKWAGMTNQLSDDFLNEIDKHNFVIYLSYETGNIESALEIAKAGKAILKSGGIGIKVESAGKAFMKEHWIHLLTDFEESNLYEMYVLDSISNEQGHIYSCGMHNLGLKDTIIVGEDFNDAITLIKSFNYFVLMDKPKLKENHTFSPSEEWPTFKITEQKNQPNKDHELFGNTFGMWNLEKASR